jgi:hypothetical protein
LAPGKAVAGGFRAPWVQNTFPHTHADDEDGFILSLEENTIA